MTKYIKNPKKLTYFVAHDGKTAFAYGEVSPSQQMTTGQPYLYQTTDLNEYELKLKEFNITLNDEIDEPPLEYTEWLEQQEI